MPTGSSMRIIKALSPEGFETLATDLGHESYRGRQLFEWVYKKGTHSVEEMTNLPKTFRNSLASHCTFSPLSLVQLQTSRDGTAKALFTLDSGRKVETVLIPSEEAKRFTACVSSQVGCAMGCTFCATGLMGFQQNLLPGEIYDQVLFMDRLARERYRRGLSNVVFMGMGEPLLNYSNVRRSLDLISHPGALGLSRRRITVSTVGLARRIRVMADDDPGARLAISLHAPTQEKRSQILPINRRLGTGLDTLLESIKYYCARTRRRVTFEYCLFKGFNDTEEDALALARICSQVRCLVNLIMYNAVEGLSFERTTEARLEAFMQRLASRGVRVTVRRSRGEDIDAACGQLAVNTTG